jgi:hypothetical protein
MQTKQGVLAAAEWSPIYPGADLPPVGEKVLLINGITKLAPRWGKLALDADESYWLLENEAWAFSNFTHYLRVPAYPSVEDTIHRATRKPAAASYIGEEAAASDELLAKLEQALKVVDTRIDSCGIAIQPAYDIADNVARNAVYQAAPALLARVRTAEANLAAALNTLNLHNAPAGRVSNAIGVEAPASQWISVDDRLPETHKYTAHGWFEQYSSDLVLAYEKGEKKARLYYCDEKGQWRMSGVEFHGYYAQVTHWQPLPTPPAHV